MLFLDLRNISFLVVDDNTFMRQLLKRMLVAFKVGGIKEACDGADALKLLQTGFSPDIILTDAEMPIMDGLELARMIRKSEDIEDHFTPIILVTAYTDLAHIFAARDAGINEFLAKPVSATELYRRIDSVIEKPRPFVEAGRFFGPDRRRRELRFGGMERRSHEAEEIQSEMSNQR